MDMDQFIIQTLQFYSRALPRLNQGGQMGWVGVCAISLLFTFMQQSIDKDQELSCRNHT